MFGRFTVPRAEHVGFVSRFLGDQKSRRSANGFNALKN